MMHETLFSDLARAGIVIEAHTAITSELLVILGDTAKDDGGPDFDSLMNMADLPECPKCGRPTCIFTLSTSTQPAKTRDSEGFVDVDSVDAPETSFEDWGKI